MPMLNWMLALRVMGYVCSVTIYLCNDVVIAFVLSQRIVDVTDDVIYATVSYHIMVPDVVHNHISQPDVAQFFGSPEILSYTTPRTYSISYNTSYCKIS